MLGYFPEVSAHTSLTALVRQLVVLELSGASRNCYGLLPRRLWDRFLPQSPANSAVTPLVILYDTFFARLFMLEPSMRTLFEENMIRQSKFLVGLVNIMVSRAR